ncbi:N-acetylmuramoyl-L-alanine amidase [Xanthomonas cassavae CFBP 4642]|uniref:N-acetylmuramoyl-L-alanine amidase n=1 Tax=Xanthomonas cassavae CFBP 4642 TaxID=1219375 RepID=A0ABS8HN51_9XANT|nr:N-acetylmuramoyl-L-alanine amidase [Xanthomonas cassavae CFBP 4642]
MHSRGLYANHVQADQMVTIHTNAASNAGTAQTTASGSRLFYNGSKTGASTLASNLTVGHAQDHLCAARHGRRQTVRAGHRLQLQTIVGADNQRLAGRPMSERSSFQRSSLDNAR